MNNKLDFIFGRRSIRSFKTDDVSEATVKQLLEAAMAAPSAVARDPWRFIVVREQAMREKIVEKLPYGKMLLQCPVGIIVCGDLEAAHDKQLSYMIQDCSAATQNILLAAHALGLGSCWLGIHPREERIEHIRELFKLPPSIIPIAGIAIGHPAETKEARTRYNPDSVKLGKWA